MKRSRNTVVDNLIDTHFDLVFLGNELDVHASIKLRAHAVFALASSTLRTERNEGVYGHHTPLQHLNTREAKIISQWGLK